MTTQILSSLNHQSRVSVEELRESLIAHPSPGEGSQRSQEMPLARDVRRWEILNSEVLDSSLEAPLACMTSDSAMTDPGLSGTKIFSSC
mmetsp:Transcript_101269/g.166438  ORF Transcript_101269/g.166438 Transcript_101269/m.166438 type:complete len:89 (+) Transcript_101269:135-401(+)